MFEGRTLLVATMHAKEQVIGPLAKSVLGVEVSVPTGINTDLLGTFTGEIHRVKDPVETLRDKCKMALDHTGMDLCIASEGSFGPHPAFYFVPADEELIMLMDRKHGLEIVARELTTETNFASKKIDDWNVLEAFALQAGFPEHGLILRTDPVSPNYIVKGITDWDILKQAHETMNIDNPGSVIVVETDMRAMHNPTRMKVIESAMHKLLQNIQSLCPNCQVPGFVVTDVEEGLPCLHCNNPTRSILKNISTCSHCGHIESLLYPKGKNFEDPMYCDYCNP
jgi:hypothetical protein